MLYKYETHLHTSEVSKCGKNTAVEMMRAHKKAGYTGVFVTDHFFNGNCTIPRHLSWKEQVDLFVRGYKLAESEGEKLDLDVFFAWEYVNNPFGEDYLIYNLDYDFLLAHPEQEHLPFEEYSRLIRENGGYLIQAHPYRTADYILYEANPKVDLIDGVEVNNTTSDSPHNHNELAWELARANPQLMRISGTDIHNTDLVGLGGVAFPYRIKSSQHFIDALKAGDGYLIIDGEITDMEGNIVDKTV